ncbi:hypothetical protein HNP81_000022 [Peribacillus huizhouensis]|uniref:Uncharacterized protein n=1 Tax=Peribacillus huizhouensis TaxID=1501239 RepID=A0ABR6CIB3_9BACI|nr:hypothetical protein [Peribacillus huizhouensis]
MLKSNVNYKIGTKRRHDHHYIDNISCFDRTDKNSQNYIKVMSDVLIEDSCPLGPVQNS